MKLKFKNDLQDFIINPEFSDIKNLKIEYPKDEDSSLSFNDVKLLFVFQIKELDYSMSMKIMKNLNKNK